MPQRIEVNVKTGERRVIDLTQAEIDDANARSAAEEAERVSRPKVLTVEGLAEALKRKGHLSDTDVEDAKETRRRDR